MKKIILLNFIQSILLFILIYSYFSFKDSLINGIFILFILLSILLEMCTYSKYISSRMDIEMMMFISYISVILFIYVGMYSLGNKYLIVFIFLLILSLNIIKVFFIFKKGKIEKNIVTVKNKFILEKFILYMYFLLTIIGTASKSVYIPTIIAIFVATLFLKNNKKKVLYILFIIPYIILYYL